MQRILKFALIGFTALVLMNGYSGIQKQNNRLHLQNIEIKSTTTELRELESRYKALEGEKDKESQDYKKRLRELENERERLKKELQAKEAEKLRLAQASRTKVAHATSSERKVVSGSVSTAQVKQWIVDASNHYGVDPNLLLRIANCESGYNPNAVNYNYYENGHPSGLFQHISGYWPARAERYGFGGASVFDAKAQAYVTAGMFRDGASYLWECKG